MIRPSPPPPHFSFGARLLGKDMSWLAIGVFLLSVAGLAAFHFYVFSMRPVPGPAAKFYPAAKNHQNIDTDGWVTTGAMLPGNALAVRAMRPLYPAIITAAGALGVVHIPPDFKRGEPGKLPPVHEPIDVWRCIRVLQIANVGFFLLSLWIFYAMCRHFYHDIFSAGCAAIAAGSGFGFGFMVTQAIPETLGYLVAVFALAAVLLGSEMDGRRTRFAREATVWGFIGLLIGVLLLGKELFCIPMFIGLYLLGTRRFAGLVPFCLAVVLPFGLWNYYVVHILGAYDPKAYLREYRFVVWLWEDLGPLSWAGRLQMLVGNLVLQIRSLFEAFAYLPVLLAIGALWLRPPFPGAWRLLLAYAASVYLLFLASNMVVPRLMFITWPVVYFLAWSVIRALSLRAAEKFASGTSRLNTPPRILEGAIVLLFVLAGTQHLYRFWYYG